MVKVLLCGQVNGQWDVIFNRVSKLNSTANNNPFEVLICIGKVFPLPLEYTKDNKVPILTYVLPANENIDELMKDQEQLKVYQEIQNNQPSIEIGENFYCLGMEGILTIKELTVVYLAGTPSASSTLVGPFQYTEKHIQSLIDKAEGLSVGIDFLLTAEYPSNFQNLLPQQQLPRELNSIRGCSKLQALLQQVHPKYHIVSCDSIQNDDPGVFYQRLPYLSVNPASGQKYITRLIGLAGINSTKDKTRKYLHALQVTPIEEAMTVEIPVGTTQNPYDNTTSSNPALKRQKTRNYVSSEGRLSSERIVELSSESSNNANQFFYDAKAVNRSKISMNRQQRSGPRPPQIPDREECWFCLATPELERHLIISIGQHAYLAAPKGALGPDHILIVPIEHVKSTQDVTNETSAEILKFKDALRRYFDAKKMDMIIIDRNIPTIGASHCHIQVIGVERDLGFNARTIFDQEGLKYNVKFEEIPDDTDIKDITKEKSYLYIEVPDKEKKVVRLIHYVDGKHYMQFGRHAVACVLKEPKRANWKVCVLPKEEEKAMTESFKKNWKQYDFTLDE